MQSQSFYSPYAYKPPPPPAAAPAMLPAPRAPNAEEMRMRSTSLQIWQEIFAATIPSTEQFLGDTKCSVLDYRHGIIEAHMFVSTSFLALIITSGTGSSMKRCSTLIPMGQVLSWSRAIKVCTPQAPYVKVKIAKTTDRPDALHIYTADTRLHLLFDFQTPYDKFCYVFDTAWRAVHNKTEISIPKSGGSQNASMQFNFPITTPGSLPMMYGTGTPSGLPPLFPNFASPFATTGGGQYMQGIAPMNMTETTPARLTMGSGGMMPLGHIKPPFATGAATLSGGGLGMGGMPSSFPGLQLNGMSGLSGMPVMSLTLQPIPPMSPIQAPGTPNQSNMKLQLQMPGMQLTGNYGQGQGQVQVPGQQQQPASPPQHQHSQLQLQQQQFPQQQFQQYQQTPQQQFAQQSQQQQLELQQQQLQFQMQMQLQMQPSPVPPVAQQIQGQLQPMPHVEERFKKPDAVPSPTASPLNAASGDSFGSVGQDKPKPLPLPDTSQIKAANDQEIETLTFGATEVDPEALSVVVTPSRLTFGLGCRQAPVDSELMETLTATNPIRERASFRILQKTSEKCVLTFEPSSGTLHPGKSMSIVAKMRVLCTTSNLSPEVLIVAWRGQQRDFDAKGSRRAFGRFAMTLESQLTTRLDKDELTVFGNPVGDGSYGTVWHGQYRGLDVAVKLLKRQESLTEQSLSEFLEEVEMMEKLRHPCVINFIGSVRVPGHLAIVTEFCEYGSMNAAIKKKLLSWPLKLKCLLDCARGMDFLHRSNIMHRDLKPDNLLMVSMEVKAPVVCKISDFGTTRAVSRFAEDSEKTHGVGTPIFMAPEVMNNKPYEKPADVYSFALMMYNVLADKHPYSDDSDIRHPWQFAQLIIQGKRPKINPDWPEAFVALMVLGWSRVPAERPSFSDMVVRIDEMLKKELLRIKEAATNPAATNPQ